ncbi:MAG: hypothetical protein RLZZ450_7050 [Pseudomonadota bacterium]|jgi:hypothetical protein
MTQPVRLSAALVQEARTTGETMERSIAGQIEYWARLGRAVEGVLRLEQLQALKKRGDLHALGEAIADTEDNRQKVNAYLAARPFPHFERGPEEGQLVKVDEDGTRTIGHFVGREFKPLDSSLAGPRARFDEAR